MPEINLSQSSGTLLRTAIVYGSFGAGKTHFVATYPRVAILGSARETGWETVRYMKPATFYEPKRPPRFFAVSNIMEVDRDINRTILPAVRNGDIQTICVELSVYSEDVIRSLKPDAGANGWMPYRTLEEHITELDALTKQIPGLRIIYTALAAEAKNEKHPAGLLLAGRALEKRLPALLNLAGFMLAENIGGETIRTLYLRPYEGFPARHRYGDRLPDVIRNPTFRKLEGLLKGDLVADALGNVTEVERPKLAAVAGLPPLMKALR